MTRKSRDHNEQGERASERCARNKSKVEGWLASENTSACLSVSHSLHSLWARYLVLFGHTVLLSKAAGSGASHCHSLLFSPRAISSSFSLSLPRLLLLRWSLRPPFSAFLAHSPVLSHECLLQPLLNSCIGAARYRYPFLPRVLLLSHAFSLLSHHLAVCTSILLFFLCLSLGLSRYCLLLSSLLLSSCALSCSLSVLVVYF